MPGELICAEIPTNYYQRKRVNQEPASENETRALISIFSGIFKPWPAYIQLFQREDRLLQTGERLCLQSEKLQNGKHLQKCSGYRLEKGIAGGARVKKAGAKPEMGSPEQFYAEVIRQPLWQLRFRNTAKTIWKNCV